jgi:hypothetical protein
MAASVHSQSVRWSVYRPLDAVGSGEYGPGSPDRKRRTIDCHGHYVREKVSSLGGIGVKYMKVHKLSHSEARQGPGKCLDSYPSHQRF